MKVSEERARNHGEVLTPRWMVRQMLAPLSSEIVADGRILDLCSGPGAFLRELLAMRLHALDGTGGTAAILRAISGLYGFELMADNAEESRYRLMDDLHSYLLSVATLPETEHPVILARAERIVDQNIMQLDVLAQPVGEIKVPRWDEACESFELMALGSGFFQIIISNPPYQKNISAEGLRNRSKATPIYNLFYDWARALNPDHISFIMPAKWYTGGWGLDKWRVSVLSDRHIRILHDWRDSGAIFENTEVNGGICWVLWSRDYAGDAEVVRYDRSGAQLSKNVRPLLEPGADFFVRNEASLSILRKVNAFNLTPGTRFSDAMLATTPFGIPSNFTDYATEPSEAKPLALYYIKEREYYVAPAQVSANRDVVDEWKVFFPLCHNQHSAQIIGKPKVAGPGEVCTHSYVAAKGFVSQAEVESAISYMKTRFFRFLAGQLKISPIATRQVYRLIPVQSWDHLWSDAELYAMYDFTPGEIAHIEATISAMV